MNNDNRPRPKPKLRKEVLRVLASVELQQVQGGGLCARVMSRYCHTTWDTTGGE